MRAILILILIGMIANPVFAEDCLTWELKGKMDAKTEHSAKNWFLGSFTSGVMLGLIGTGIVTVFAATSNPKPEVVNIENEVNRICYVDGYTGAAKRKNTLSALGGGLVGTAILLTIYAISVSASD